MGFGVLPVDLGQLGVGRLGEGVGPERKCVYLITCCLISLRASLQGQPRGAFNIRSRGPPMAESGVAPS